MKYLEKLVAAGALGCASAVSAAPVHIEVPGAHVIVVRPMDTWTGNTTTAEYSLDSLTRRKTAFAYDDGTGKLRYPSNKPTSTNPIPTQMEMLVHSGLAKYGFTNNGSSGFSNRMSEPTTINPAQMPTFLAAQNEVFKEFVVRQGDPATLASRIKWRKALNVVATMAFIGAGADKFGINNSANYVFTLGIPEGLAKLTIGERRALSTVPAPTFDFAGYSSVDVRKLAIDDRVGQILIAYKGEKTAAVEDVALAAGIVTASAADTSKEAVELARVQDFEMRKAIWSDCVAGGRCKAN